MIHLATGVLVRDGRVLLVASRYPNHVEPLWNLPGGRQQTGELLAETVVREFAEETGLDVAVRELAYVSESYDGATHFLNVTFVVVSPFDSAQDDKPFDSAQGDTAHAGPSTSALRAFAQDDKQKGDHVVGVEWVPIEEVAERIVVRVVREPLVAYLNGTLSRRYAGYHDAGITIEWPRGAS